MLKLLYGAFVGLMIVLFSGCVSTSDIQVESIKSEKANLNGYKSYQIVDGSGVIHDSKEIWIPDNLDVNVEIKQMINTQLAKKGKIPVTKNPDFYVVYLAGGDMDALEIKIDKKGKETIKNVSVAAIAIMFIDADTGEIIWISSAEGKLKELSVIDMKKRLDYAIKKMLSSI